MSTWLHRIGSFSARNRRFVLAAWIVIAMGAVLLNRTVGGEAVDNFEVPGVESQAATDMLKDRFPERAGATAMVVFHTEGGAVTDPAFAVGIAATIDEIRALPEVLAVTEPLASPRSISPDATICRIASTENVLNIVHFLLDHGFKGFQRFWSDNHLITNKESRRSFHSCKNSH